MTCLLPTLVRIGSLGPTGPRLRSKSAAEAGALATVRASAPAAASRYHRFPVNGFILALPSSLKRILEREEILARSRTGPLWHFPHPAHDRRETPAEPLRTIWRRFYAQSMGDWLLNLPLFETVLLVFVAVCLVAAAVYLVLSASFSVFWSASSRSGLERFRSRQARRRDRGERVSRHRHRRREPPGRAEGQPAPARQSPYRASGDAVMGVHGATALDDGNHADPSHRGHENHSRVAARR